MGGCKRHPASCRGMALEAVIPSICWTGRPGAGEEGLGEDFVSVTCGVKGKAQPYIHSLTMSELMSELWNGVSPSAGPAHRPIRVPGSGAGAARLDSLELPRAASGLILIRSRLHLPVLSGRGELVVEVNLVSVGHGFNEHPVAFHAIAGDLCELSARALFLAHPRDFALG